MTILLVKSRGNWTDEMDLYGFALFTERAWNGHLKQVKSTVFKKEPAPNWEFGPNVISVGSNASVCFETFDEYQTLFEVQELTQEVAETFCEFFSIKVNTVTQPSSYWGTFLTLDHWEGENVNH